MTDVENDEQILDQLRQWLRETRQEAAELGEAAASAALSSRGFGLDRLVEEFTALRHELKLQTRSSRSLEERVETSLMSLADAAAIFRSATAQQASAASEPSGKNFAAILAELDEALERGRDKWKKNLARLTGPSSTATLSQLDELYAGQSWWHRRFTAAYHQRIRQKIERSEELARSEREALLTALLSGYDLIQQRLLRTMADAGLMRIATVGRPVDPEQMIVVEVVDAPGSPGQVIEEIRRGYTWKGALLRPAEVRAIRPRYDTDSVTSPPSSPADGGAGIEGL